MAKAKKISQLTELTLPADDDFLAIVDTSATETKKITKANLLGELNNLTTSEIQHIEGLDQSIATTDAPTFAGLHIGTAYSLPTTDGTDGQSFITDGAGNITWKKVSVDTGVILPFAGDNAPSGFFICDGRAVSRTNYADLYNVIGTKYGAGDGSTTFNIPNLKGRVPVGLDSSDSDFDTLGNTGGEKAHQLTIDEMPAHTHGVNLAHAGGNMAGSDTPATSEPHSTTSTGGDQPHNNLQPYIVLNYIIKY